MNAVRGPSPPDPLAAPRLNLKLAGIDAGRPLTGPETVHLDVTNGCNTNCITCWDHSPLLTVARSSAWKRQRVEATVMEALLDDVRSLGGLKAIILSGMGDPFTHPDIYRLIGAVKSRGLHLTIITNLIPADPVRVLDLGVDQLLIGVHAASEGPYKAFHPSFKADEWSRLLDMLRLFQAAGRRYKHVQVVSRVNCHELVDMIRLAGDYSAAQVNFKLASLKEGTEACRITEDQRRLLAEDLVPAAERLAGELGVVHNLDVFAEQLRAGGAATASIADVGCFMGYVYSRILVDGTVLYCCNTDVRVGTLAGGARFSDLWAGEAWNALRARMRRGDYFESCNQCGKLNQNVKLARRFAAAYGEARLHEVTGRGGTAMEEAPR
jgi:MoaA/NifB/PqqE/SkfB family radical SAM enzyme